MTALAADRNTARYDGKLTGYPVAASTKIYKGSLVCLNASGYAVAAANTAAYKFVGVAISQADNSSGSNGDINVEVRTEGVFDFVSSGLAVTDVGETVYVSDDQTVTKTVGNNIVVGVLDAYVSATVARVKIGKIAAEAPKLAVYGFYVANAAAEDDTDMSANTGADTGRTTFRLPYGGSVIAINAECQNDLTAGTATVTPLLNGVASSNLAAALSDTVQKHYDTQAVGIEKVTAGQTIGVNYACDASFAAGTTPSIWAEVYVLLDA